MKKNQIVLGLSLVLLLTITLTLLNSKSIASEKKQCCNKECPKTPAEEHLIINSLNKFIASI